MSSKPPAKEMMTTAKKLVTAKILVTDELAVINVSSRQGAAEYSKEIEILSGRRVTSIACFFFTESYCLLIPAIL